MSEVGFWEDVKDFAIKLNRTSLPILGKASACSLTHSGEATPGVVVSDVVTANGFSTLRGYLLGVEPGVLSVELRRGEQGDIISQNLTVNSGRSAVELWAYTVSDEFLTKVIRSDMRDERTSSAASEGVDDVKAVREADRENNMCNELLMRLHPDRSMLGDCNDVLERIASLQQQALARKDIIKELIGRSLVSKLSAQCQQKTNRRQTDCLRFLDEAMPYAVGNNDFDRYYTEYINHVSALFLLAATASNSGFFALEEGCCKPADLFEFYLGADVIPEQLCPDAAPKGAKAPTSQKGQDDVDERLSEQDRGLSAQSTQLVFESVQRIPILVSEALLHTWGSRMTDNTRSYLSIVQEVLRLLSSKAGVDVSWTVSEVSLGVVSTSVRAAELASLEGVDDFVFVSDFETVSRDDLLSSRIRVIPVKRAGDADTDSQARCLAFGDTEGDQCQAFADWLAGELQRPPFLAQEAVAPEQYSRALVVFIVLFYCVLAATVRWFLGRLRDRGDGDAGRDCGVVKL